MRTKTNKYGVASKKDRTYNGVVYDSKVEMLRTPELDLLLENKAITGYERQVEFPLGEDTVYVADYFVHGFNQSNATASWVEEIKGFETREFKRIRRLWKDYGPCPMFIYKRRGSGWKVERLEGAQNA